MPEQVVQGLVILVQWLEIAGASLLVLGFAVATVRYLLALRGNGALNAYVGYRKAIGRVVLIGLEVLVAATIIRTITVGPTPEALGRLALMIAIRTILSWAMVLEITGRWPWQKAPAAQGP
jgi:uncharacterized membrane protein